MLTGSRLLQEMSPRIADCGVYTGNVPGYFSHSHPMWEITIHCHGRIQTQEGDNVVDTLPGTILIHAPNVLHQDIATSSYQLIYVVFQYETLEPWNPVLHDDAELSLETTCRAIIKEWHSDLRNRAGMLEALSRQLVMLIERRACTPPTTESQQIVSKAIAIIEARYNQSVTIRDLCKELSITTVGLRKEFIKVRGQTPFEYLQSVRLRHAIAGIHTSSLKLDAIAAVNGFSSASHMSRQIKALTGCSPGQLRRQGQLPASVRCL